MFVIIVMYDLLCIKKYAKTFVHNYNLYVDEYYVKSKLNILK